MVILTEFSQFPLLGNDLSQEGNNASRKKGEEKTTANEVTPTRDQSQSPWMAATISVPTKGRCR